MNNIALPPLKTIHVWSVDLDLEWDFPDCLSIDEMERSSRFKQKLHSKRYSRGRKALRSIIGEYLNANPTSIQFKYYSNGKPYLNCSPNESTLFFNLSHSENQMLVAFSTSDEVGLDIEMTRKFPDEAEIVKRFFSKLEIDNYLSLPEKMRTQGFLNAWTRKEALVKTIGTGLQTPLSSFSVSLDPRKPCQIDDFSNFDENTEDWSLIDISTHPIYTAALASKIKISDLMSFNFNDSTPTNND